MIRDMNFGGVHVVGGDGDDAIEAGMNKKKKAKKKKKKKIT